MTFDEFKASLRNAVPPSGLSKSLQALWHDGHDDWEGSHNVAQDINTPEGSWIHAYLHRKEGDAGNAAYWYHKAGKPVPAVSLELEWELITKELLKKHKA
jgi:hypothetical protein